MLTGQKNVSLQRLRSKPRVVGGQGDVLALLSEGFMQEGKDGALPKGIAGIDQLVGTALEATFPGHLLVHGPSQEAMEVQRAGLACYAQRRQAAVGVASMRLQPLFASNSSFPRLTSPDVVRYPFQQLVCQNVKHGSSSNRAVAAAHISLPLVMHLEAALRALHPHKKPVHCGSVHGLVGGLCTCQHQCGHCRICWSKVRKLIGAATKTSGVILAAR
mmetsp:Transcript_31034/g.69918  ORF Transcript_31034/g.69918 Transcript_31034/m.69918 type:complete len:217 (-) Transcript_31034:352-1002(-)